MIRPGFEFKPHQVNDLSQSNHGTDTWFLNYHIALLNYGLFYAYVRIRVVEQERQVEQVPVEDNTNIFLRRQAPVHHTTILDFYFELLPLCLCELCIRLIVVDWNRSRIMETFQVTLGDLASIWKTLAIAKQCI
jgi:hypothetical protein